MFISHEYEAIFVHIQRTGGNSIQKIFEEHDPNLIEVIPVDPSKNRTKHAWITDIEAAIDRDVFRRYTKFCVVRNPFDRMASWYFHFKDGRNEGDAPIKMSRGSELGAAEEFALRFEAIGDRVKRAINENASTFEEFVMLPRDYPGGLFERLYTNQIDYISRGDDVLVDEVLRFETLPGDFEALAGKMGFPGRLPHVNASSRDRKYQEYYSPKTRELIAERFNRDCERFGYRF